MELLKTKEWADRIAPMIQRINENDDVSAKMIDVFAEALLLGGELERQKSSGAEKKKARPRKS